MMRIPPPMLRGLMCLLVLLLVSACAEAPRGIKNQDNCFCINEIGQPNTAPGCEDSSSAKPLPKRTLPDEENIPEPLRGKDVGPITYIVVKVQAKVLDTSEIIYKRLIEQSGFINIFRAVALMFIIFYGMGIAVGMIQLNAKEFVVRIIKLAIVWSFIEVQSGWDQFNYWVIGFFETATNELSGLLAGAFSGMEVNNDEFFAYDVFAFIDDKIVNFFFSQRFSVIMAAMMADAGGGMVIGVLMGLLVFTYVSALVEGLVVYMLSGIARALIFAIAPIFFLFLLFQQTQNIFSSWVKQLINYSMQPIFVIAFLALFNGILFGFFQDMFSIKHAICFSKMEAGGAGQSFELKFWQFESVEANGAAAQPTANTPTAVISMPDLFVAVMLCFVMMKMMGWVKETVSQLTEGGLTFQSGGLGALRREITQAANQGMGNTPRAGPPGH